MKNSRRDNAPYLNTYKKVQAVMALFILGLLLCVILFISYEREKILHESMANSFETEKNLLATLLTEPLLRSDYVQVRNTLEGFFERYTAYEKLELRAPNGFEVFSASRSRAERLYQWQGEIEVGLSHVAPHILVLEKSTADATFMGMHKGFAVALFVVVFVAAFGRLLWVVVRAMGLDPLSGEMERQQRSYQSITERGGFCWPTSPLCRCWVIP
ncbi:MAG: hypothetical protein LC645_09590 [Geobacteraceae bacterium]|nr:hypothetical protein [Geobacteraceae bacterium]